MDRQLNRDLMKPAGRRPAVLLLGCLMLLLALSARPMLAGSAPEGLSAADWAQIQTMLPGPAAPAQSAYLKASNVGAEDYFGHSVAVDGDTIVVGAPMEDGGVTYPGDNSLTDAGAAYVFVRHFLGKWILQAYLKASNAEAEDHFGAYVAVDGDTVVISATGEDGDGTGGPYNNSAPYAGAAYVFVRSGTSWSQQAYLKASNVEAFDTFGSSVAVDGDTVVVGAFQEDGNGTGGPSDNSATDAGAAYVFTRSGGIWSEQAYLKASNAGAYDLFGFSVGVAGDTVVAGALGEDGNGMGGPSDNTATDAGAAYVFVRSGTTWRMPQYLKASNAGAEDYFGDSVAVDGDTVVIGATYEDGNGTDGPYNNSAPDAGAAYVFIRSVGDWSEQAYLKASNAGAFDHFGTSVAVDGDAVVAGALEEDSNDTAGPSDNSATDAGAAYVFVRSGTSWSELQYLKASVAEANDLFGISVALDGDMVVVGAPNEDGNGTGPLDNSKGNSGAAYIFQEPTGTIVIVKDASPDGATEFSFTESITGGGGAFALTDPADNSETFSDVPTGSYTVTEDGETGWTLVSISCADPDNGSSESGTAATIDLDIGETVICTFTNRRDKGTIVIVKDATPADDTPFSFTEDITSGGAFTLTDPADSSETFSDVPAGSYTVTEDGETNWTLDDVSCDDGNSTGDTGTGAATINVEKDETVTCTFSNSLDTGTITIIKSAEPQDDTEFDFIHDFIEVFSVNAQAVGGEFTLQDPSANSETFTVVAGSYTVTEAETDGWTLDDITCDDLNSSGDTGARAATINLEDGEKVTCTFSNSYDPPQPALLYIAPNQNNGVVGGVAYNDEDIVVNTLNTSDWAMYFDGSDVGITKNLTDFTFTPDDCLLMTFNGNQNVPGVGLVKPQDLVKFCPTSTGTTTNGTFTMYFDGSDVGLSSSGEIIDAVEVLANGDLVISTKGSSNIPQPPAAPVKGKKNDLLIFHGTQYGPTTTGTWDIYFNSTLVSGLKKENIISLYMDGAGDKYVSFWDAYPNVGGISGDQNDILIIHADNTVTKFWTGADWGYTGRVHGLHIVPEN